MPKFKVGDRVRVLKDESYISQAGHVAPGDAGVVTTVGWASYVNIDGKPRAGNRNGWPFYDHEIELIKEDVMSKESDVVTLKKEDLQKAYAEGCSDVKRVLDKLYPGQTKPKEEWVDVTKELTLDFEKAFGNGSSYIKVLHDKKQIGNIRQGVGIYLWGHGGAYRISYSDADVWKIERKNT